MTPATHRFFPFLLTLAMYGFRRLILFCGRRQNNQALSAFLNETLCISARIFGRDRVCSPLAFDHCGNAALPPQRLSAIGSIEMGQMSARTSRSVYATCEAKRKSAHNPTWRVVQIERSMWSNVNSHPPWTTSDTGGKDLVYSQVWREMATPIRLHSLSKKSHLGIQGK